MDGPLQSAHYGDYDSDQYGNAAEAKRARKNHATLVARNRRSQLKSKKRRNAGSRGADNTVVGITHRRNHRWSW